MSSPVRSDPFDNVTRTDLFLPSSIQISFASFAPKPGWTGVRTLSDQIWTHVFYILYMLTLLFIKWVHHPWHFTCTVLVLSVEMWNEIKKHQYFLNFHGKLAEVKLKWKMRVFFFLLADLVKACKVWFSLPLLRQ